MYVGRIVAVGCTREGRLAALYRVSSRSFPNRYAVLRPGVAAIIPKPGHEGDILRSPYIAYNCLRAVGDCVVASNGSHTDPIAEKIDGGMRLRDALATVLQAMDYEHDSLDTPRIAAAVNQRTREAYLGIVRKDALLVQAVTPGPGEAFYLATYEHNAPSAEYRDPAFDAPDAAAACAYVLRQGTFARLEKPVTAACAVASPAGHFELAVCEDADVDAPAANR